MHPIHQHPDVALAFIRAEHAERVERARAAALARSRPRRPSRFRLRRIPARHAPPEPAVLGHA